MGASSLTLVSTSTKPNRKALPHHSPSPRLKREDHCLPTSQDKLFSDWKVLVGPTDWQNHSAGSEGAQRYRLHNLPSSYFGPGVYELALCPTEFSSSHGRRSSSCPRKDTTVIVYVGQAENIRTRLQNYGCCGSHLEGSMELLKGGKFQQSENTSPNLWQTKPDAAEKTFDPLNSSDKKEDGCCCPCLFTKAFSRGYSIAFRWTAVESKGDAEAIEAGLLKIFDYAWNRGNNGERRPYDAFKKLQQQMAATITSTESRRWYKSSKWAIKPIRIEAGKLNNRQEKRSVITVLKNRFWKLNKISSRLSVVDEGSKLYGALVTLPWKSQVKEESSCNVKHKEHTNFWPQKANVCGITDAWGMVCKETPMQGRKRCEAHKGMRLLSSSRLVCTATTKRHAMAVLAFKEDGTKNDIHEPRQLLVCGYFLEDGSKCMVVPEKGRKRCTSHKGRRIRV